MSEREKYAPGPAAGASVDKDVHEDGAKWALIVIRELRHPPEMVWQALTDPAQLSEWASFDADRNLALPRTRGVRYAASLSPDRMPRRVEELLEAGLGDAP